MKSSYFERLCQIHQAQIDLWNGVVTPDASIITRVIVPEKHRQQGVATRLFQQVLSDADNEGVTLLLEINPYGQMDYQHLREWYERLGFVYHLEGEGCGWLERKPVGIGEAYEVVDTLHQDHRAFTEGIVP